ncbi:hypothetical protein GWI33_022789 [Rhynchophorus ferrugineus]|uniref:RRM domain-containing protein n=1 Tax=Rhynchophorus ferrugineus TaxID=354439 RepID=A0A834IN20_RHYFE|nr:hypothetical protein GWI33_022789 [Rhynchophorus ferrugineus]
MVKAEAKTPLKRKSLANKSPAKKQKVENNSPSKPVGPKNASAPPKKPNQVAKEKSNQQSNKKINKKNNKATSEVDSPKKVAQFAGTGQLKGNKKQNKPKNGTTKAPSAEGQKKKRKMFATLITESKAKAGTKDAGLLKSLNDKISAIESKPELSKTAKRKLALLQKLKIVVEEGNDRNKKEKVEKPKAGKAKETAVKGTATPKKQKVIEKVKEEEEDDDDDDDEEEEDSDEEAEDEEDGAEVDDDDDDDDEEDGDDDDEEEDEEDEDEAPPIQGGDSQNIASKFQQKTKDININDLKKNDLMQTGQKRYVLFVGNIPYDTTKQDLMTHFSKAGEILHIRIPTDKQNNKPRGFGYIELRDEITYQKCLSMHHTQLKNRRINVLYTQGGKKKGSIKKNEIKEKNMKLHALRKQGKLAGSVKENQKRSFRRKKQRQEKLDSQEN